MTGLLHMEDIMLDNFYWNYAYMYSNFDILVQYPWGVDNDLSSLSHRSFVWYYYYLPEMFYNEELLDHPSLVLIYSYLYINMWRPGFGKVEPLSYYGQVTDLKMLAYALYNYYYLHLIILGVIFLLVIVGVISLLLVRNVFVKRQEFFKQQMQSYTRHIYVLGDVGFPTENNKNK